MSDIDAPWYVVTFAYGLGFIIAALPILQIYAHIKMQDYRDSPDHPSKRKRGENE